MKYSFLGVLLHANADSFLDRGDPREEWLRYGSDLKSIAAFRANLDEIVEIAGQRGDSLLLATFAIDATHPIHSSWGILDNTIAAVRAHNDVVRDVTARNSIHLVDL